jgi:hypothetical protein
LQALRPIEWLIVAFAFLVWLALILPAWRFRVVERFLGADSSTGAAGTPTGQANPPPTG